jgi:hypothetical protein
VTVGGIGGALLVTGVIVGVVAHGHYNDAIKNCAMTDKGPVCDPTSYQHAVDAGSLADVGTVFGAVGVAALAAGAIVYFTAPRDVIVAPTASGQAAGLAISGRF